MSARTLMFAIVLAMTFASQGFCLDQSGEAMLSFADHLYDQGDYYRAITEYERVLFYFPGSPLASTARFQIAMSYVKGEKFAQAIEGFKRLAADLGPDPLGEKSQFMLAAALIRKGDYVPAIQALEAYLRMFPRGDLRDDVQIKLGWCYLRTGDWMRASREFLELPPDSALAREGKELSELSKNYPALPHKSPALAGTLSILPGAGQLYVDRPGDAFGSFLLNGGFIWGATESYRRGNRVAAGILAVFEIGWYAGNIYGAVNGAHKFNRSAEKQYFDQLNSRYGVTISQMSGGDIVASLHVAF